jgi:putative aldouronate transport system permease protein
MIDGARYFTIFMRIIMPLSKPILATIVVFAGVGQWNSFLDNYFLVNNPHIQTLQLLLYNYLSSAQTFATMSTADITKSAGSMVITAESVKMCITVIVTSPILFLYPFLQRYFVKGIMLGAVKG